MVNKTKTFIGKGASVLDAVSDADKKMNRWLVRTKSVLVSTSIALLKTAGEPYTYVIMVVYNGQVE